MPLWVDKVITFLELSWVLFLIPAIVVFYLRKDFLALRFVCVTGVFFLFGALIYDSLKEFDKDIYIYRYLVWAFNDIAWMALIAYLGIKDKVYLMWLKEYLKKMYTIFQSLLFLQKNSQFIQKCF